MNFQLGIQTKFLAIVLGSTIVLLLIASSVHYFSTREVNRVNVQGKLLRRIDNSPVADAVIYASETPVVVLSKQPEAQDSVVLGGASAEALKPIGKTAADGSFRVVVPNTPGATVLAVDSQLAATLTRTANLSTTDGSSNFLAESPCSFEGRIYDEGGRALPGGFISLVPFGMFEKPHWQTWSDDKGRFRFERLPAGRLTVTAVFPRTAYALNHEYSASAVVDVGAGQSSIINFGPSGSIKGKIKDTKKRPIANAEVTVRNTSFSRAGRLAAHLRSGENGDYRIYALPHLVDYRAYLHNPDPQDSVQWLDLGPIHLPSGSEKWLDLELSGIKAQIKIKPQSVDHPFPKVIEKTKKPPVQRLLIFPKKDSQPCYDLTQDMLLSKDRKRGAYDPQFGMFFVRCLPSGSYTVIAQVEGYGAGIEEDYTIFPNTDPKAIEIAVIRGGPATIRVFDTNKREISHANVSVVLNDLIEIAHGKSGEELYPGPGTFDLRVEAEGYKTYSQRFNVLVATPKVIEVTMQKEMEKKSTEESK